MTKINLSFPAWDQYESPSIEVIDIHTEGVLCSSMTGSGIDDAEEVDWSEL